MGKERENLVDSIFSVGKVNRVQMLCEKNTIDHIGFKTTALDLQGFA